MISSAHHKAYFIISIADCKRHITANSKYQHGWARKYLRRKCKQFNASNRTTSDSQENCV